jgi:hypothetical protein
MTAQALKAQMTQRGALLPGPAVGRAVGVLLGESERGGEQPRFLARERRVGRADRAQPSAGRGGIAVLAAHPGDAGAHAVGELAHGRLSDRGEKLVAVGEVPVGGVGRHAHDPGRLAEHHGVRAAGPGQLEPGGDQAVADGAARTAPQRRPACLRCCLVGRHGPRITKWTASTNSSYCGQRPLSVRRLAVSKNTTAGVPRQGQAWVTAAEWFAGGERIWYDPESARVLSEEEAAAAPGALRVFERVAAAGHGADAVWLTLLPGFPDGSYGWAQVDRILGDGPRPRLYVEPVGQGDSDKPRGYRYSTVERADLVEALWRHHGVRATVVVTFDYSSLALLELLRRQLDGTMTAPVITAAFMVNGGLFADAHTHPWQGTPLLRSPVGALAMRGWQRSPRAFDTGWTRARLYARSYQPAPAELAELRSAITRRNGAAFVHNAAGFVAEHRRHARRWDLAAIAREMDGTVALYVGGSQEDPYEHRQIPATRQRVPQAEILAFPGGHLTTSEHPNLLASAIRDIAQRHGVGTPATASR